MNTLNLIKSAAATVALVGLNSAFAADATGSMSLGASVNAYCKTVAADAVTIAAFNPDTAQTAESKISVYCTTGTTATIKLDAGTNADGTQRRMKAGRDYLNYAIRVAANGADWNATDSTQSVIGAGLNSKLEKTAYIAVPAQANAKPGIYSDSVTVTVSY